MYNSVIIVAAGEGKRFGNIRKQFFELRSKPVLAYAIEPFENCELINEIVIVTKEEDIEYCQKRIVTAYNYKKVVKILAGGKERQDSVHKGICNLNTNTELVLVHDGARPFIEIDNIKSLIDMALQHSCCILGSKVKDTIKICTSDNIVSQTLDRSSLWNIQTPQVFRYSIIKEAYKKAFEDGFYGTDDSMLVERLGYKVILVEGKTSNIKITTQEDIMAGEAVLENRDTNVKRNGEIEAN